MVTSYALYILIGLISYILMAYLGTFTLNSGEEGVCLGASEFIMLLTLACFTLISLSDSKSVSSAKDSKPKVYTGLVQETSRK